MRRDVSIKEIRDLIKFSGIEIEAMKRGSGFIHLYAKNYNEMTDFRGFAVVNEIAISISNPLNANDRTYAVVLGRVQEEVNA
jgi:hypothetical protein